MKWIELRFKTTEEASDAISEMLTSIGSGGVAIEDPNDIRREISRPNTLDYVDDEFVQSLGEDVIIKAYFQADANINELQSLVKEKLSFISNFLSIGEGYTGYTEIDEEDWSTAWKKYYKPIKISNFIVVKPSWEEYEAKSEEIVVELDPGMAFGTGTHETTRMCAVLLEKYIKQGDVLMDLGCGTGILSIIGVKLGAKNAKAIDIDEVAVRVAKDNCRLNYVNSNIEVLKGVLDDVKPEKNDIVIANIIANVIIDISKSIPYYVKTGGYFITSGIIKERKDEVLEAYRKNGFTCQEVIEMGEWVAIAFKCQGSL